MRFMLILALLCVSCVARQDGGSYTKSEAAIVAGAAVALTAVQIAREKKARSNGKAQGGDCCQVCADCTFPCGDMCVPDGTICTRPVGCACVRSENDTDTQREPVNPANCNNANMGIIVQ